MATTANVLSGNSHHSAGSLSFSYFKSTGIFCDGHIPCINDFHFVFSTSLHFSVGSILCRKIEQPFVLYLLTEINQIITLVSRSRPMVTTDIRQLQRMRQRIQQTAGKGIRFHDSPRHSPPFAQKIVSMLPAFH